MIDLWRGLSSRDQVDLELNIAINKRSLSDYMLQPRNGILSLFARRLCGNGCYLAGGARDFSALSMELDLNQK